MEKKFSANPYNKNNILVTSNHIIDIMNKLNINDYKISNKVKFLTESQWWSKDQLQTYQNLLLKRLIFYSYNNINALM